jgi:hydroxyacylglutathione hydrolase
MTEIHALVDEGLGNSSYLVDLGDGRALAVDPARDPRPYLAAAKARRLRIALAAETHLHADFVSGSRELAAHGAQVLASRSAGLAFAHRSLDDGEEVDLGGLVLRAVATPGHAPEHVAYLLLDAGRPLALFSGGALLPGGVARTDLVSPEQTEPLARAAWRSLSQRLLTLPPSLGVHPTHGAGSFCSAGEGERRITTIGAERAGNPLVAAGSEERFVARLLDGLGSYPPYFLRLREVNRRGPRLLDERERLLARLPLAEARGRLESGALLIDARPIADFAAGHVPGALSIALRPSFVSWLGWLVGPERLLLFVLGEGQDRAELVRQCHGIGYERLAGELDGGMAVWRAAGLPEERVELIGPDQVGEGPVVDVRQASEVAAGHLPGAVTVELGALQGAADRLPDRPLTVMCAHGERAMTGASLLARAGRHDLRVLRGGAPDWSAATGRPLVHSSTERS